MKEYYKHENTNENEISTWCENLETKNQIDHNAHYFPYYTNIPSENTPTCASNVSTTAGALKGKYHY